MTGGWPVRSEWMASLAAVAFIGLMAVRAPAWADPVAVRFVEGTAQTFLTLKSGSGQEIALGEYQQIPKGNAVELRLVFRFRDGSEHEERATFSQRDTFRLERYQLRQHGPSFPTALEASFREDGVYSARWRKPGKKEETDDGRLELPPDVSNALPPILLKNLARGASATLHVVAFTPKPRVIKFELSPAGEATFRVGPVRRKASHYVGKPELGPVLGTLAKAVGKYPPDYHFWFLSGEAPAFLAAELPLYTEGPIWRIELSSPRWPSPKR
jgi:hypothetical protein